jgi:hypothetical protein
VTRPPAAARRRTLDYAPAGVAALATAAALLALALAYTPATHTGAPAPDAPRRAAAAVPASYALPASPGLTRTTNIQLGMQYVTVSFRVASKYAGTPRARIYNNGPHAIRVVTLKVNGMSDRGRYLRPGQYQTLARGWVNVAGETAVATFAVVDQANGIPGRATLRLGGGLAPVRPTGLVAAVQAAAGGLAADGDYGPLTSARLQYIRAHCWALPGTVARLQGAYGITADGIWGGQTEDAYERLRNAALGKY